MHFNLGALVQHSYQQMNMLYSAAALLLMLQAYITGSALRWVDQIPVFCYSSNELNIDTPSVPAARIVANQ